MSKCQPKAKRGRSQSIRSSSVLKCLVCKHPQYSLRALNKHYQTNHSKREMIDGILKVSITDKEVTENNQNVVEDDTSNSSDSPPSRLTKRKYPPISGEAAVGHNYNFRTPSSVLKQRNSLAVSSPSLSPCYSSTSNSNSPSPYFTPEQSVRRPRRRKQLLDSLMFDVEDDNSSKSPIVKLPPCSEIKEGIRKLKEQAASFGNLDSDTDSCSDMAMPSVYCSFCSNGYKSIEHLEAHILECPKKGENVKSIDETAHKVYVCNVCDLEFSAKLALKNHLTEHLKDDVIDDIVQLENDFDLRPETNFVHQYFTYFITGYNIGVNDKGASTHDELQFKFYEHFLKDNKYEGQSK